MLSRNKRWLLSLCLFALLAGLAVFIGISVNHMTSKNDPTETTKASPDSESSSSESRENEPAKSSSPEETKAPETSASAEEPEETTEPTTEEPSSTLPHVDGSPVNALSQTTLDHIRDLYSITPEAYQIGEARDENNRPADLLTLQDRFSDISDKISIFNTKGASSHEVSLMFVLTEDYENNTAYILNRLAEKKVHATFFLNRHFAESYPEVVQRILDEGHELGSLGASSPDDGLAIYALEDQMNDMLALQRYIEETFDYSMQSFYFRCDIFSEAALKLAAELGYNVRYYSIDYEDVSPTRAIDANRMLEVIESKLHDNASILLHNANAATLIMLPNLINDLEEQQYKITLLH